MQISNCVKRCVTNNSGLYLTGSAARNKAERFRGKLPKVMENLQWGKIFINLLSNWQK